MQLPSRLVCGVAALIAVSLGTSACSDADTASERPSSSAPTSAVTPAGVEPTAISTSTELNTVNGRAITISDAAIATSYGRRGGPDGYLGRPLGPVVTLPTGGQYITFVNGSLYRNPISGNVFAVHGQIGAFWGTLGFQAGTLGYPTSDETRVDGTLQQSFDRGTLVYSHGRVTLADR